MHNSNPSLPQKTVKNECPDCLYMDLQKVKVAEDGLDKPLVKQFDLHLTLSFNEQWQELPGGRVKFGLRGGKLQLDLKNGKIIHNYRELNNSSSQISAKLSKEKPLWNFKSNTDNFIFQEKITNVKLATIGVSSNNNVVRATFEVSIGDICLTAVEGIWDSNLSPNKRALIERRIVLWIINYKLKPYISRVEL